MTSPDLLLVHGAWHGAWCWERLMPVLQAKSLHADAIDLPGHGHSSEPHGDLYADAEAVRSRLDTYDDPVLLVGHSYGGMVITDAGVHDAVAGLVYVCAFLPTAGQTLLDLFRVSPPKAEPSSELLAHLRFTGDGSATYLDRDGAIDALYADCDPSDQQWAVAQLGHHSGASANQAPRHLAWRTKPTTYVVCSADRAVPRWQQRAMAVNANHGVELDADHSPFLSRPRDLANILEVAAMRS